MVWSLEKKTNSIANFLQAQHIQIKKRNPASVPLFPWVSVISSDESGESERSSRTPLPELSPITVDQGPYTVGVPLGQEPLPQLCAAELLFCPLPSWTWLRRGCWCCSSRAARRIIIIGRRVIRRRAHSRRTIRLSLACALVGVGRECGPLPCVHNKITNFTAP